MYSNSIDTIVAIATAPGAGSVGVVRLSGIDLSGYMDAVLGGCLIPRRATYKQFFDAQGECLDTGIAVFFPAPESFTGESVLELQGHGGSVVLAQLVQRCVDLGARQARPGEFSERAFLNGKLDLAQAEAVADLIQASSVQAAKSAVRSMQGEFSRAVESLVEKVIEVRVFVEASIDFPEEEIDFLSDPKLLGAIQQLVVQLGGILDKARQGALLREGMTVVLVGKPNVGKSSLLNCLVGDDVAIVTDEAGTTRDVLRHMVSLNGVPVQFIDTAGLRATNSVIEKEGIRRAWAEVEAADQVIFMVDAMDGEGTDIRALWPEYFTRCGDSNQRVTMVLNKIDCSGHEPGRIDNNLPTLGISAKYGLGIGELTAYLLERMGYVATGVSVFAARRRHVIALSNALTQIEAGQSQLQKFGSGELLAEDLRVAQQSLSEITGRFSSDDLLGHIFSSFCIGK
ncbi:MAG: tRNA uridine-5-carboxymethylaminomethyl(34) synthesis GTPase MnmE [Porticoccaceae bacterium]|nr:tRNA uridine-5-carboxymethylaminomethyl(34) synthesis GTPase MnmE [Porticoccaceae bacterium]